MERDTSEHAARPRGPLTELLRAPEQTVGTHVDVGHEAATPPGLEVTTLVELIAVEGRKLVFDVAGRRVNWNSAFAPHVSAS